MTLYNTSIQYAFMLTMAGHHSYCMVPFIIVIAWFHFCPSYLKRCTLAEVIFKTIFVFLCSLYSLIPRLTTVTFSCTYSQRLHYHFDALRESLGMRLHFFNTNIRLAKAGVRNMNYTVHALERYLCLPCECCSCVNCLPQMCNYPQYYITVMIRVDFLLYFFIG